MAAARILFDSIAEAQQSTPFFIDETGFGIWLSTDAAELLMGRTCIEVQRDALHIPSMDKLGQPLDTVLQEFFKHRAELLGLEVFHPARGYWTLSGTGALQVEDVLIASSSEPVDRTELADLAAEILKSGQQDAVAYEVGGVVHVLRER